MELDKLKRKNKKNVKGKKKGNCFNCNKLGYFI